MSRLPTPGGDNNVWATILNDFLSVVLAADGTLKAGVVGSAEIDATQAAAIRSALALYSTTQIDASEAALEASMQALIDEGLSYIAPHDDNTGIVSIAAGATTVTTLDLGSVVAGDLFIVNSQLRAVKGGTGGNVTCSVLKSSGSATAVFNHNSGQLAQSLGTIGSSVAYDMAMSGIYRITVTGTLIIKLQATSAGSNASCAAGECELYAYTLRTK